MEDHDRPVAVAFAAKLKELRLAAGLTMAELGAAVEPTMHASAVARYEAGERLPSWGAVVRLAAALDVTPGVFGPPPAKPRRRKP